MPRLTPLAAAAVVLALGVHGSSSASIDGEEHPQALLKQQLPDPGYLPEELRPVLRNRMQRHGDDMVQLVLAVTLLKRDMVKSSADRIASEPRFARPIVGSDDALNNALPEKFFTLQAEVAERARSLSAAASRRDDRALASAFGRLTETCVACHSAFLEPKPGSPKRR